MRKNIATFDLYYCAHAKSQPNYIWPQGSHSAGEFQMLNLCTCDKTDVQQVNFTSQISAPPPGTCEVYLPKFTRDIGVCLPGELHLPNFLNPQGIHLVGEFHLPSLPTKKLQVCQVNFACQICEPPKIYVWPVNFACQSLPVHACQVNFT